MEAGIRKEEFVAAGKACKAMQTLTALGFSRRALASAPETDNTRRGLAGGRGECRGGGGGDEAEGG